MTNTGPDQLARPPGPVRDLALRLGAASSPSARRVALTQTGRMRSRLESESWMAFTARQTISTDACAFDWRAKFGPFGWVSARDALAGGAGELDVTALGFIPIVRTRRTPALVRGELMRYLAELAWAPDAILNNAALCWRLDGPDRLTVSAGRDEGMGEVQLTLDTEGRIASAFAPDRPRSSTPPTLPTPWRGRFSDYRRHEGRWLPFSGEVAWEIDGKEIVYWQGHILRWREV